jgi:Rad3-related DNA helicase
MEKVIESLNSSSNALLQSPTGTGKVFLNFRPLVFYVQVWLGLIIKKKYLT